jgi:hypothetical protein
MATNSRYVAISRNSRSMPVIDVGSALHSAPTPLPKVGVVPVRLDL